MHWVLRYWVAIVIAIASIGVGVWLAMLSSGASKTPRKVTPTAGDNESIFNTYAPGVGDNLSNLANPPINTNKTAKKAVPGTYPTPLPLPTDQVPWGTGASLPADAGRGQGDHPSPSTGGSNSGSGSSLPSSEVPWGTGPSQQ